MNLVQAKMVRLENVSIEKFAYGVYAGAAGSLSMNHVDIQDVATAGVCLQPLSGAFTTPRS